MTKGLGFLFAAVQYSLTHRYAWDVRLLMGGCGETRLRSRTFQHIGAHAAIEIEWPYLFSQ